MRCKHNMIFKQKDKKKKVVGSNMANYQNTFPAGNRSPFVTVCHLEATLTIHALLCNFLALAAITTQRFCL